MKETWNEQFVVLGRIKRPEHEADNSHTSNVQLKNKWNHTFHFYVVSAVTLTIGTSWMWSASGSVRFTLRANAPVHLWVTGLDAAQKRAASCSCEGSNSGLSTIRLTPYGLTYRNATYSCCDGCNFLTPFKQAFCCSDTHCGRYSSQEHVFTAVLTATLRHKKEQEIACKTRKDCCPTA